MKKISILLCSAFVMLGTGCTIDSTIDVEQYNKKVIIGANIGDTSTRTYLGDNYIDAEEKSRYPILWNEGDKIAVNGKVSEGLASEYEGKSNAQFVVADVTAPYNIVYPAEIANLDCTAVTFPAEQTYAENSFASKAAVMAGYVEEGGDLASVKMQAVCAFIKITLHGTKEIKDLTLSANNLEAIAGEFAVDCKEATMAPLAGVDYVKVTEIKYDTEGKAVVVVAVPAGEYTKGFSIIINTTDGYNLTKTFGTSSGVTIAKNTIININQPIDTATDKIATKRITSAETLQAFLTAASGDYADWKNDKGVVVLANDIDLAGVAITPATSFDGVFNGNGYVIKNWGSNGAALFTTLAAGGLVKNVVIDSSCTLTYPAGEVPFGFVVATNNGTVSGCVNNADITYTGDLTNAQRGAIVGTSEEGSTVANCVNNGTITLTLSAHTNDTMHLGTVSGRIVTAEIKNCVNYGTLNITFKDNTAKNIYMGGVTGASNSKTATTECYNYGNINVVAEKGFGAVSCVGGVTGYSAGPIKNCYNEGAIHLRSDEAEVGDALGDVKGCVVAGITPYQNSPIYGCTNKGELRVDCGTFVGRNSIGGITDKNNQSYSTAAPCMGGIVGYGYSSTNVIFSIQNCHNYGAVIYNQLDSSGDGATYSGRHAFGGIVGAPAGDITNCNNYGDITVNCLTADRTAVGENLMPIIGGISGGDYYPYTQNASNITNCVNSGNLYIACDGKKSNAAYGGIVGWPAVESADATVKCTNCTNEGNITLSGKGKARCGGIQGGSGHMNNCINTGTITATSEVTNSCAIGGLCGFHSQKHEITGCESRGNVISLSEDKTLRIGGAIGNNGNAANTVLQNTKVNCVVSAPEGAGIGMVVGYFNGTSKTIKFGEDGKPCQVCGTLVRRGTTTVIDSSEKVTPANMFDTAGQYTASVHISTYVEWLNETPATL